MIRTKQLKVKLSEFQFECDLNYLRLRKLIVDKKDNSRYLSLCPTEKSRDMCLDMHVLKSSRYTSTLSVCLRLAAMPTHRHARFVVHIYRDLCSAEVISFQEQALTELREKYRLNKFLGKWLGHYLLHGQEVNPTEIGI